MIKNIEIFQKVYEERSFSEAAKSFFCSQPTISNSIKQLENVLNTKLFIRNGHNQITPTHDGNQFYLDSLKIINEWENATYRINQTKKQKKINLNVAGTQTTLSSTIPHLMKSLISSLNKINIKIQTINPNDALQLLLTHKITFALLEKPLINENVYSIEFAYNDLVLAGNPDQIWLLREKDSITYHYTMQYFREHNLRPQKNIQCDNDEIIKRLLSQGIGQSIVSKRLISPTINYQQLPKEYHQKFYFIYNKSITNHKISQLLKQIKNILIQSNI